MRMQLNVAKAVLRRYKDGAFPDDLGKISLSEADYELLTSERSWTAEDRMRVCNAIDAIGFHQCESIGIARTQMPAEIKAVLISTLVCPINRDVAAYWVADSAPAVDLALGSQPRDVTHEQMISFVLMIESEPGFGEFHMIAAKKLGYHVEEVTTGRKKPPEVQPNVAPEPEQ